jgi:hypothetical protein
MNKFVVDLGERVLGSFAAGALSVIPLDALDITHLDWKSALAVGAGTAVITLLKGVAAKFRGNSDSASLAKTV